MPALDIFRSRLIETYREVREPDMFLAGMFEVRPGNISDTEQVAIDVVREDEHISPVVNTCEGPTLNESTLFTTKEWTPPTLNEMMPFDCKEFLKRGPGETQFQATDRGFMAAFAERLMDGMGQLEQKMRRNREYQGSQILQTGLLDLEGETGDVVYSIDFQPKATHFPTAGTAWDAGGADIYGDLEALADVIRTDSLRDADEIILGDDSFTAFILDPVIRELLNNRRIDIGNVRPELRDTGAKFQGTIHIGNYEFDILTYNGRGIVPGSGTKTKFISSDSCIMRARSGRLDTVFAGIPVITAPDPRFADILPGRISIPRAVDISPNIYSSLNGKQVNLELESRPLLVPVGIDTFGNIDTGV